MTTMTKTTFTTALVTGASSGIGAEFCRALAGRCQRIIAVARRAHELAALRDELAAEVEVVPVVADLATIEGVARAIEALRQLGPVELLVNNAGVAAYGPFAQSDTESDQAMMRVLMDAPVELCRAAVPMMIAAGRGAIINVASTSACLSLPNMALYGACKSFLLSFSATLQQEVAANGLTVQCLCPGPTRTEIHQPMIAAGLDTNQLPDAMWMEAAAVVAASLEGLDAGQSVVVPGEMNRAQVVESLQAQASALAAH